MITSLITLFSSGAVGSLFGLIGGYFNRKLDIQLKKLDNEQELKKADKDLEFMKAEYEQRTKIATIEASRDTEVAGYNAMSASYDYAPITGTSFIDSLARAIRPLLTIAFFFSTVYIFYVLNSYVSIQEMDKEALKDLYIKCIEWFLFQAGIAIGWWFANRPSKK